VVENFRCTGRPGLSPDPAVHTHTHTHTQSLQNTPLLNLTSAQSPTVFRKRLKTRLFRRSFPPISRNVNVNVNDNVICLAHHQRKKTLMRWMC